VASFRVTYHTTGGPFSRVIDAADAVAAEKAALTDLEDALLTFTEKDTRFTLRTAQVAAVSVEEEKTTAAGGERRSAGFLGR
jgi:hypothetical protein